MAKFKKDFDWEQIARDQQEPEEIIYVSKSEIKRDAQKYRNIASQLVSLSKTKLVQLGLDDALIDSIKQVNDLPSMEARRRQINFVSKQLRNYDLELLEKSFHDSNPTNHSGENAQLDKRVRVTIERLQDPKFTELTITQLQNQISGIDVDLVRQLLAETQVGTEKNLVTTHLYQYFYDLYYKGLK